MSDVLGAATFSGASSLSAEGFVQEHIEYARYIVEPFSIRSFVIDDWRDTILITPLDTRPVIQDLHS